MVIETKRGRKLLLRVGSVLVTIVAVACFSIRLVPTLLSNQNNTALTAAGFIMPDGAVEVIKNGYDDAYFSVSEVEEMVSQASSVPEITESAVTSEKRQSNHPRKHMCLQNRIIRYMKDAQHIRLMKCRLQM